MKTLISNAILVDGTGADRRPADVLLDGPVIAAVADAGTLTAAETGARPHHRRHRSGPEPRLHRHARAF